MSSEHDDMTTETWAFIKGWGGLYCVSDLGNIMSYHTGRARVLRPFQCGYRGEYLGITLCRDKEHKTRTIHSLVAEAFIGPYPPGKEINHIDGNKRNNRPGNLEYVTPVENMRHAHEVLGRGYGRPPYGRTGEKHPMAKLTQVKADEIKLLYSTGAYTQKAIGEIYNVSRRTIGNVVTGKSWG